jgi:aspartyl-tRNA(Asn)/glutamyl-tRNA(Gln) amidotransferase subunit C
MKRKTAIYPLQVGRSCNEAFRQRKPKVTISKTEVQHVARLARLELDPETTDAMVAQLGTILDYMETLNRVDTAGIAATAHMAAARTPLREDTETGHLEREAALQNAPHKDEESFLVPRVIG